MDVKNAFLNGFIEEEMYIEQPEGFETFDRDSHVCRLKRELYGMKHTCIVLFHDSLVDYTINMEGF